MDDVQSTAGRLAKRNLAFKHVKFRLILSKRMFGQYRFQAFIMKQRVAYGSFTYLVSKNTVTFAFGCRKNP
ncbi:hypothetical protein GFC29_3017 [Anoxybacillus sp. B7M1]|uniref:hypothetical protein n=1 Tax=unclassified Anoxybacillus TaxID=2639704 RepID=UPI0005CD9ECA|nr:MULTISPECIES: hypothetical protein [unclassified Anoxybacillus]ANB59091.1 hypothetical protein GFC28_2418 [Anoxybacillus sp. B2M1]ANB62778.1 hypothetical protein GFC29_3017 [Anoxybacillus sp. B7M1]